MSVYPLMLMPVSYEDIRAMADQCTALVCPIVSWPWSRRVLPVKEMTNLADR